MRHKSRGIRATKNPRQNERRKILLGGQELRGGREGGGRIEDKIDKRRATMNQRPMCLDRLRDLAKDPAG